MQTDEVQYEIKEREITVIIDERTQEYGDAIDLASFSYTVKHNGEEVGAIVDGDDPFELAVLNAPALFVPDEYRVSGNTIDANYKVTFEGGLLKIVKRKVKVSFADTTSEYGDPIKTVTFTLSRDALPGDAIVNGDKLDITTIANAHIYDEVGNYTVHVEWTDKGLYELIVSDEAVYHIVKREVIVTANDVFAIYGDAYDTSASSWTAKRANGLTGDAFVNGYDPRFTFGDLTVKNVGTYSIPCAVGNINGNYNIVITGGNLHIGTRPVTVTVSDKTTEYTGDDIAVGNVEGVDWRVTAGNVIAGDSLGVALTVERLNGSLSNVGEYAISGTSNNSNYDVTIVSGTYTVTKAVNSWLREYSVSDFEEDAFADGGELDADSLPQAKFGDCIIAYYLDEECTKLYEGDIRDALEGTYYVKVTVLDSANWSGLEGKYTLHVLYNYLSTKQDLDIGSYCVALAVEFVAGLLALIFVRRRKDKSNKSNNK